MKTKDSLNSALIPLISPGQILKEEFIIPLGLKDIDVAKALEIHPSRLSEIINGKRVITPDTAIRLSYFFETTPQFWLNLQNNYDLEKLNELNQQKYKRIKLGRKRNKAFKLKPSSLSKLSDGS